MAAFYMTLSTNDVNVVRQEAYVLIPVGAKMQRPGFWNWPNGYHPLPTGQSEMPISLNDLGTPTTSRIYDVPERSEFRLCTEAYRLGPDFEGCILVVRRLGGGSYATEVVCPGDAEWDDCAQHLTEETPSRTKQWGYS